MKLTSREKLFVVVGTAVIVFAVGFLLYQSTRPFFERLAFDPAKLNQEKIELQRIAHQYQNLRRFRNIEQSSQNFSAEIESMLMQYGLLHFASVNPSQENIQGGYLKKIIRISFSEVDIVAVLQFVKAVEDRQGFRVELFQSRMLSQKKVGSYSIKINVASFERG